MEFNKSVSNPMLVGCIELMKEEDTPDHRNMFVAELTKAQFLSPALMEPAPVEGPDGQLKPAPGTKVQFPMLAAPDGRKFFMAFTDAYEYEKWQEKAEKKLPTFALKFDDYAAMLLGKDAQGNVSPGLGFVINPLGANVVVPREMVANIMAVRIAQAKQAAAKQTGTPVLQPQDKQQ
ncbi:MAG: SseB family protein [Acetatifactor sp.]